MRYNNIHNIIGEGSQNTTIRKFEITTSLGISMMRQLKPRMTLLSRASLGETI